MQNIPDNIKDAKNKVSENVQNVAGNVPSSVEKVSDKIGDAIKDAKDKLPEITPTPPGLKAQSSVQDLKARLEWGEPALTIIDVSDRNTFNDGHIVGAMSMPKDGLLERAQASLNTSRDIYVYGETDAETSAAASQLRQAGFQCVAELKGGLAAWKAVGGPTDGVSESRNLPDGDDYNVVSKVKEQGQTPKK